jgi:hypothetical protein
MTSTALFPLPPNSRQRNAEHGMAACEQRKCLRIALMTACLAGCAGGNPRPSNLENCLEDKRGCMESRLSLAEHETLIQVRHQRHFQECMEGRRCDLESLDAVQRRKVQEALSRFNYQACLRGESSCVFAGLSDEEKTKVAAAETARNLDRCVNGLASCKQWALSSIQLVAVREAYLHRNFAACLNGVGTLLRCNPDDLTTAQSIQVRERRLAVNIYICANALMGCVEDWLTPEQRETFSAVRAKLAR